jgi:hydrogenase expression/formation protein HypC
LRVSKRKEQMCLGIPGKIVDVYEAAGLQMGIVDFDGVRREVCLAYVPEAQIGDYAIIHVGFALNLISEADAQETLELLRQIGEINAETGDPESMDEASQ